MLLQKASAGSCDQNGIFFRMNDNYYYFPWRVVFLMTITLLRCFLPHGENVQVYYLPLEREQLRGTRLHYTNCSSSVLECGFFCSFSGFKKKWEESVHGE